MIKGRSCGPAFDLCVGYETVKIFILFGYDVRRFLTLGCYGFVDLLHDLELDVIRYLLGFHILVIFVIKRL